MIIDFHTHTFPDAIAERAIKKLGIPTRMKNYHNGTQNGLLQSMKEANVDYSILLPIATKPSQTASINENAILLNSISDQTGLISFGAIHPDETDVASVLKGLANANVRGIKLHPHFQDTFVDDPKYISIIKTAEYYDLCVLIHAGNDASYPNAKTASVEHLSHLLDCVNYSKIILAHMGGLGVSEEVEKRLLDRDVYFDTALSLRTIQPAEGTFRDPEEQPPISQDRFSHFVKVHGADRILFGTDCPWDSQKEMIQTIQSSGLSQHEVDLILGENAQKLLKL